MFKNYIFILSFLFCFNTVSQSIESIQIDEDQKISEFLINYDISPNDFFILNPRPNLINLETEMEEQMLFH